MTMTPEETALLAAISADPLPDAARLIYADWLEERGSPLAPYLRAEYDLVALAPGDPRFRQGLDRLEQIVRSTVTPLGGWEHRLILERLWGKMERRRDSDPQCKEYGSQVHRYRLAPPLAEVDLMALERRLGFLLPSEYRAFVLRVCNGPIGPGYGLEPLLPASAPASLAEVCPLTDADAEAVLEEMRSGGMPEFAIPAGSPGMLYLADAGGGASSFLVLTGQQRGKVWTAGDAFSAPEFDFKDYTPHGFFSWYEAWLGSR